MSDTVLGVPWQGQIHVSFEQVMHGGNTLKLVDLCVIEVNDLDMCRCCHTQ